MPWGGDNKRCSIRVRGSGRLGDDSHRFTQGSSGGGERQGAQHTPAVNGKAQPTLEMICLCMFSTAAAEQGLSSAEFPP